MSTRHMLWRRLRDPHGRLTDKGWAGRSLEASILKPALVGMALLHGISALSAMITLGGMPAGMALTAGHGAMVAVAVAVLRGGPGRVLLVTASWALLVANWTLAPSPESLLLFVACWMGNLTNALPVLLLRGGLSWRLPLAAWVLMPLAMVGLRPDWISLSLLHGVPVTLLAMTVATRIGLSYLVDYTDAADAEAHALEARTAALTIRKAATRQAAEDARVLHDTAINTLGAIASGGAAIADRDAVRQRCLADIAAIDALRSQRRDDLAARPGLRDAIRPIGIRVRPLGLDGEALAAAEALLPTPVVQAMSRAAAEAVQNAAKHSGADEVEVVIERSGASLQMIIRDRGIGIQATAAHSGGLARSIVQRAEQAGIRVAIHSAPGAGTAVTLTHQRDPQPQVAQPLPGGEPTATRDELVRQLRSRAVFALSAGLVGVGIALAALNHPGEATPEWLMVLVMAITCGLAWRERDRPRLSAGTAVALIAGAPLAFALSAWAVDFGQDRPFLWQAIGPIAPLLALLIMPLPTAIKALGVAVYALTVLVLSAFVVDAAPEAARITGVAGLLGLGLLAGVLSFLRGLATVAERARAAQMEVFEVGLAMAAVDAAAESRQRWRDAGLDDSVALLRAIGHGEADPDDPQIRQRCANEEAFLRQLSLLDPELTRMGTWFARALHVSRQRGVGLIVRSGATDANAVDADRFGESLLTVLAALPSGTSLTTALFAGARGLTMTLVAPTPHLAAVQARIDHLVRVVTARTLGRQDWVEITASGAPA